MKLLPVALRVEGLRILVVGGGTIALRKASTLLECGAHVVIVAPWLCEELQALRWQFEYSEREFSQRDLENCTLVFVCTNNEKLNAQIAEQARARNLWCQVASDASQSTLHSAATVRRDKICIGITTGGGSPALAKRLKEEVENCVGGEWARLLELIDEQREILKLNVETQSERAQFWRSLLESKVLSLLREGKEEEALEAYHSAIKDLLKAQR